MNSDHKTAWNNCLSKIKEDVGDQGFETWFKPIKPMSLEHKVLTIQVPSQFFYEYLEEHYVALLRVVINTQLGKDFRLEYSVIVDQGDASNQPYTVKLPINTSGFTGRKSNSRERMSSMDLFLSLMPLSL